MSDEVRYTSWTNDIDDVRRNVQAELRRRHVERTERWPEFVERANGGSMSEQGLVRVPDREVVAVRTSGVHDHIERVKFTDGTDESASEAIAAIKAHEAHYVMRLEGQSLPLLLRVQQCPDCLEEVLWA